MIRRETAKSIGGGRPARLEAVVEKLCKVISAGGKCHTPVLPAPHFGATGPADDGKRGRAMPVSHEVGFPAGRVSGGADPCSGLSV